MKPLISIIIPVFNTEKYLQSCLDSIVSQTLKNIEIICVDDCSTDGSVSVVRDYQQKDSRICIVSMDENSGAGPCRNEGIKQAKGDFIAFMDSDDLYASDDCLEKLHHSAVENKARVVGGNMLTFINDDFDGMVIWDKGNITSNGLYFYDHYPYSHGYTRFIYQRDFIVKNNLFFPPLRRYQDPVWFAAVMTKAEKFYGLNIPVYAYRKSHQSITYTAQKIKDVLEGMIINIKLFNEENFLNHCNNEKKELYNFMYRAIYGSVLQPSESVKIISVISDFYRAHDDISFGVKNCFGFFKMGLILLKNRIKREFY